jgi:hypothetical protein
MQVSKRMVLVNVRIGYSSQQEPVRSFLSSVGVACRNQICLMLRRESAWG